MTRIRKEVGKSEEVGAYGEAIGNSVLEFRGIYFVSRVGTESERGKVAA